MAGSDLRMATEILTETPPRTFTLPRGRALPLGKRPLLMGILNLTPDSFSDGGRWNDPVQAVERGLALLSQGADLLDLGAESTRPGGGVYGEGARTVPAEEELERLLPVLTALRRETDAPLSVDTRKGEVAQAALDAGADLINDVAGGADPALLAAVARAGCPVVLMHSRGELSSMQRGIHFADLLGEVAGELGRMADRALAAGVARGQIVLDPGIGFGKTAEQSLELLARVGELSRLGYPLLVGASRKSFLAAAGKTPAPPSERLGGSLAALARAAAGGAAIVRVHDVAESAQFLAVSAALSAMAP